jgi:hypothetical protein
VAWARTYLNALGPLTKSSRSLTGRAEHLDLSLAVGTLGVAGLRHNEP